MKSNRQDQIAEMSGLRRQRGVALVISLLLFLVVTIVGIAGIRGTILQERMAGGAYDREIGFQAAEAALRIGAQNFINNRQTFEDAISANAGDLDCSNQTCAANPSGNIPNARWSPIPDGVGGNQFSAMDSSIRPEFVVQLLGPCSPAGTGGGFTGTTDQNEAGGETGSVLNNQGTCYRITARALDPTAAANAERAQVFLQATYRM